MRKKFLISATSIVMCVVAVMPSIAFADRDSGSGKGMGDGHLQSNGSHVPRALPQRHDEIHVKGRRYYYSQGRYYQLRGQSYYEVPGPLGPWAQEFIACLRIT